MESPVETNKNTGVFVLGVTGGIGSGKSLVCKMLEALGARVVYADEEAKKLMVENPAVRREITEAFGEDSYRPDGRLNRKHIAAQIFGDDAAVAHINGIVHPRMAAVLDAAKEKAKADGIRLLVYEAALIFESGSADRLDAVAVVHAPADTRLQRVMARDGVPAESVQARMKHQLSPETLLDHADFIILNDGSIETLRERVEALYRALQLHP